MKRNILSYFSLVFIFVLLAFPGLKVLKISFISFLLVLQIFLFVTGRLKFVFDSIVILVLQVIMVIFLSAINSFLRGIQTDVIVHAFYVWSVTILVFVVLYILYCNQFVKKNEVNKIVFVSVTVYLFFKWVLLCCILILKDGYAIKEKVESFLGISLIAGYTGFLPRLMTQHDMLILISLVLILWRKILLKRTLLFVMSFFLIINGFLTYSRFFWLSLIIILSLYYLSTVRKCLLSNILQISIMLAVLVISIFVNRSLVKSIQYRLNSYETEVSNQVKLEEIQFFVKEIFNSVYTFLLGHGLGGYLPYYVRNIKEPYSYEVQWLSFIYQYGFLFFVPILIFWSFPIIYFLKNLKANYSLLVVYLLWMLACFTNPYLISSFGGTLYFVFIVNAR